MKCSLQLAFSFWVLFSTRSNANNSRDRAKYVNFLQHQNRRLRASSADTISEFTVEHGRFCSLACVKDKECLSANLKKINDDYYCQLLRKDKFQLEESDFIHDMGYNHYSIKSPCYNSPCLNSGKCEPVHSSNSYRCTCKKGTTGKQCEIKLPLTGFETSSIIGDSADLIKLITEWVGEASWKKCFDTRINGFGAKTFHDSCDHKGPTVSIIKVGSNIFGGYASASWDGSVDDYLKCKECFLFSLRNDFNITPFRVQAVFHDYALYSSFGFGPSFGEDLKLSDNANQGNSSSCDFSHSYSSHPNIPSDFEFAGSKNFNAENYEVFYKKAS